MDLDIGEGPLLPLVDPQPFRRAWVDIMPLPAGRETGVTADATAQIDEKTMLRQIVSPSLP
jgi:hypothetical protein